MEELNPFASTAYYATLAVLLFARGTDFLSTWIATPNLALEANPLAKKLGWTKGIFLNVALCFAFAFWSLPALVIATASVLVAARNFQYAWLMRSLGEERYRDWAAAVLVQTHLGLYLFCLLAQAVLFASVGGALMYFSQYNLVPFAVGMGIVTYAVAVTFYTLLSVIRVRRQVER